MSRMRKSLLVTVGVGLAGAIGAAFGTGVAQAVVASLVEIVNPTTAPVPALNVTDLGRVAYQSKIDNAGNCFEEGCSFSFPSVPAGHRVVVQHISGLVGFTAVPSYVEVQVAVSGVPLPAFFAPVPPGNNDLFSAIDQPALFYVDAPGSVQVDVTGAGTTFHSSSPQFVTLTGYELDCTEVACASIATQ